MRTHLLWILSYGFGHEKQKGAMGRTSRLMVSELCTLLILRLQSEKTSCPKNSFPGNLMELTVSSPNGTFRSRAKRNNTERDSTNVLSYSLPVCEVYKHYC